MEITRSRLTETCQKRTKHSAQISKKQNPEIFRIVALVVGMTGKIYGEGYNHISSSCHTKSIHAERDAINRAIANLQSKGQLRRRLRADLWIMRDTGTNSKPCFNCIVDCIYNNKYFNFRHIHYTHEDNPTGFVTVTARELYDTRLSYISFGNVLRMMQQGILAVPVNETGHNENKPANTGEYCRKCAIDDCNRHHKRTIYSSSKSQSQINIAHTLRVTKQAVGTLIFVGIGNTNGVYRKDCAPLDRNTEVCLL